MESIIVGRNTIGSNNNNNNEQKLVQDKGKRKISKRKEVEKSYKFKEDPLVENLALEIEEKRRWHERRVEQRKRQKQRLEYVERKLQEIEKKMKAYQDLKRREREENHK